MPAASPALARSTNRRVRSSGRWALVVAMTVPPSVIFLSSHALLSSLARLQPCAAPALRGSSLARRQVEVQHMILVVARISTYGTEAAGVLRRRRRGGQLHPRGRA